MGTFGLFAGSQFPWVMVPAAVAAFALTVAFDVRFGNARPRWRALRAWSNVRKYRDKVLSDFDPECAGLLLRAQRAVAAVTESEVMKADLIDSADNRLTLADDEWEIAQTLAGVTRARREHVPMEEVVASVRRRVESLESYAAHVREADLAYRAAMRLEEHRDLLAGTARDEKAIEQIQRLDRHVTALRGVLSGLAGDAAEE
ncbi:MAG: hypothetical protein HOY71_14910 [Nonomuraea sp.]|nr:hypothetical protein [Nonomuraea sp.]